MLEIKNKYARVEENVGHISVKSFSFKQSPLENDESLALLTLSTVTFLQMFNCEKQKSCG